MITDQAQALRDLAASARDAHRARLVAISSGKGGVGKSNVAVNLAVRLTQMGRRVALIDADLGTANADVLCNLRPQGNLAHVVAGRLTLQQAMIKAPGGFHLIPGASGLAQMAGLNEYERTRLLQQMHQLEESHDVILIDTGAGISPNVLSFILGADQLLAITTPEPTAVTDAYAVIKIVTRRRRDLEMAVLVNMARSERQGREVFDRINAVCQRFLAMTPDYAGHILSDPCVPQAVRRRRPFVMGDPHSAASVAITRLAHRLDRHAAQPSEGGLLRRMAAWLTG